MADFTGPKPDFLTEAQSNKEERVNAAIDALSQLMLYGRRDSETTGLTWGYYGGRLLVRNTPTEIANGTVALTASQNNYVQADGAGAVTVNTTGFTADKYPLYHVATDGAGVVAYYDYRSTEFEPSRLIVTANTSTAYAIDLRASQLFDLTLTANCAITFTNPASSPVRPNAFLIYLRQDATGGRAVTWPANVQWAPLVSPPPFVTIASALNIIEVRTIDGGTTYQAREWASDAV